MGDGHVDLQHICGHTYYTDLPSISGVYLFDDRSCLLIDTGATEQDAAGIRALLQDRGLTLRAIFNTHGHADHCTGNQMLRNWSGCSTFASSTEAAFIQNPILWPQTLFSADPPNVLKNKFLMAPPCPVTDVVVPGELDIAGEPFQIIGLGGHTIGHLGMVTPDRVAFLGDSLIPMSLMNGFQFHYLGDIQGELETLDWLERSNFSCNLMSHGGIDPDLATTVARNRDLLSRITGVILDAARVPSSREEILTHLVGRLGLPVNSSQYYLIMATLSAFLAYLCNSRLTRAVLDGAIMKYSAV